MVRDFILGAMLAISTWVTLAVLSLSIYRYAGYWDLLMTHTIQWGIMVSVASMMIDYALCKKLNLKWR
jgi:hypothetical protein